MEMIGFVGLGTIGGAIARNIRKAGYPMMVHDIRPEAARPLVEGGAQPAKSPAEVARHCPVVFTSSQVHGKWRKWPSGPTACCREFTAAVSMWIFPAAARISYGASKPSSGCAARGSWMRRLLLVRMGVANRSLQVLASGAFETYEKVKSLLDTFGDTVVYTGELGRGTVIKLAHNLVRRGVGLAIGEGIVLGAKAGVDPQLLWDCMRWGLEVQLHQLAKTFSETVFKGNYEAPASFDIALSRKDVGLATELGRQHNVPMPIAALVEQIMVQADRPGLVRPKHRVALSPAGGSRRH